MMTFKMLATLLLMTTSILGCTGIPKNLEAVDEFQANRYLGKWYEIARLDHSFERNLSNVSAVYTKNASGGISVTNRGYNEKTGKWKQIEGQARFIDDETVGSLKVSFFGPFYGGYHIIALDRQNYSFAMVTGPNRSYLWILARRKAVDESIYADLVSRADVWGFETAQLIRVKHNLPHE